MVALVLLKKNKEKAILRFKAEIEVIKEEIKNLNILIKAGKKPFWRFSKSYEQKLEEAKRKLQSRIITLKDSFGINYR